VGKVAEAYHSWRGKDGGYRDQRGFCQSVTIEQIRENDFMLAPGRYVQPAVEASEATSQDRIGDLATEILALMDEQRRLDDEIRTQMRALGLVG
jgi:type I restriction enzyme M protein